MYLKVVGILEHINVLDKSKFTDFSEEIPRSDGLQYCMRCFDMLNSEGVCNKGCRKNDKISCINPQISKLLRSDPTEMQSSVNRQLQCVKITHRVCYSKKRPIVHKRNNSF